MPVRTKLTPLAATSSSPSLPLVDLEPGGGPFESPIGKTFLPPTTRAPDSPSSAALAVGVEGHAPDGNHSGGGTRSLCQARRDRYGRRVVVREGMLVKVLANGPYLVSGSVPVAVQTIGADEHGDSVEWIEGRRFPDQERYALCRCGHSSNKPYCDGTHKKIGFAGTETADRLPYLQVAAEFDGPVLAVTDAQALCMGARFCHPAAGRIWDLVGESGEEAERLVKREAGLCPSGRLVAWDRLARTAFEPELEPSIGIVEDPHRGVSGPLWVRGGIAVQSAEGDLYETRSRVTLCRCGESRNKPFCDGAHTRVGFDDGLLLQPAGS